MLNYDLKIPGWMGNKDLRILSTFSSLVPENKNILEVGSFLGRSTFALYANKKESVQLEIIDPFEVPRNLSPMLKIAGDRKMFEKAFILSKEKNSLRAGFEFCLTKNITDNITINQCKSSEYKKKYEFDLVFIDGHHYGPTPFLDIIKFSNDENLILGDDFSENFFDIIKAINMSRAILKRDLIVFSYSKIWCLLPQTGYWKNTFISNNLFNI